MRKKIVALLISAVVISLAGCAFLQSRLHEIKGSILGNRYNAYFYTNNGTKFMEMSGSNIGFSNNVVKEKLYSGSDSERVASQSSVITITIDGHQVESCGSTIVFEEDGLKPDVDYKTEEIKSSADSLMDINIIAGVVNRYKNVFGKPVVVIVQSQLGDPICAYSGKNVYWEVYNDLPKTTKLMIDGKALYVHRANFQIVDSKLLK
ncbi:MAG: DUF5052 family protein [Spirochaetales bacterium]|nr:DUF5052 family protein [Spirochaetales bacterium]